jgi:AmiR/NasT family two-component response regulator
MQSHEAFDDPADAPHQESSLEELMHKVARLSGEALPAGDAALVQQLRDAVRSRAVIEQAKGIIMGERRCTAEEAFAVLVKLSQESNLKLRDVAHGLVGEAGGWTARRPG